LQKQSIANDKNNISDKKMGCDRLVVKHHIMEVTELIPGKGALVQILGWACCWGKVAHKMAYILL
jgi:hypothetical protein